jgi:hypothetical protein
VKAGRKTIAERLAAGEDARRMTPIPKPNVVCSEWESADPTITTPHEILIYPDGSALACHPDHGDVGYPTLAALETAYRINVSEPEVQS